MFCVATVVIAAVVSAGSMPSVTVVYPDGGAVGPADAFSIKIGDAVWFEQSTPIWVTVEGVKHSTHPAAADEALLKQQAVREYTGNMYGQPGGGWGHFSAVETTYIAGSTPFVATIKTFASSGLVTFTQSFPAGATNTSYGGENSISSGFPAFQPKSLPGKTNTTQRRWMAYNGWVRAALGVPVAV